MNAQQELDETIRVLAQLARHERTLPDDAMKITQAALNAAKALEAMRLN